MQRHLLISIVAVLLLLVAAARAEPRTALVIGNAAYQSAPALKTPVVDAEIVAETLRAANFDVTEIHDVHQADIGQSMRDFLDKIAQAEPGGIAFVYYSGHAARSKGENFLIPVDAVINNEDEIGDEAFRLKDLTDELVKLPLASRIIVLDASRNHQIGAAGGKPIAKGLASVPVLPGMVIAFAAAPGATSVDAGGDGDYSLYTGSLVTQMRQPGLGLEQIFKNARSEVTKATDGLQVPWTRSALQSNVRLFEATDQQASEPEPPKEPRRRRSGGADPGRVIRQILRHAPF